MLGFRVLDFEPKACEYYLHWAIWFARDMGGP